MKHVFAILFLFCTILGLVLLWRMGFKPEPMLVILCGAVFAVAAEIADLK